MPQVTVLVCLFSAGSLCDKIPALCRPDQKFVGDKCVFVSVNLLYKSLFVL